MRRNLDRRRIPFARRNPVVRVGQAGRWAEELRTRGNAVREFAARCAAVGTNRITSDALVRDARPLPSGEEERAVAANWTARELAVPIPLEEVLLGREVALRVELAVAKYSNAPPWKLFVPERVTTFTTAPALLPCCAL